MQTDEWIYTYAGVQKSGENAFIINYKWFCVFEW